MVPRRPTTTIEQRGGGSRSGLAARTLLVAILAAAGLTAQEFPGSKGLQPGQYPQPAGKPQPAPQPTPPAAEPAPPETPAAPDPYADLEFLEFETADGSRFLLAPDRETEGLPIIHWAVVTPVGVREDADGREGLARAVARASLNGTIRYGSWDSAREAAALRQLDALEREIEALRRRSQDIPDELRAELADTKARCAGLGDPKAWLEAVRACPAELETHESETAMTLHLVTAPESLHEVALLLLDRRENARLRLVRDEFRAVRAELLEAQQGAAAMVQKEVLGMAYLGSAQARPIEPIAAGWTRDDALALHRQIQRPQRSYHVLTGDFEIGEVKALMEAVFARSAIERAEPPLAPTRTTGRYRTSTITTEGPEAYALALPIPADVDVRTLAVLGRIMAGGRWSQLDRALRSGGRHDFELTFQAPFPSDSRPGLFLIQVREIGTGVGPGTGEQASFGDLIDRGLQRLQEQGVTEQQIQVAIQQVHGRLMRARSSPAALALDLANWCGVRGFDPAAALAPFEAPDGESLAELGKTLFLRAPRTEVRLERP